MQIDTSASKMASLKDKVVIITGASSGIGRSTALHLVKYSPILVLAARRAEQLEEVSTECQNLGLSSAKILCVTCNVAIEENLHKLVKEVIDKFNRIDVLINNAATIYFKRITSTKPVEFDDMIDTNVKAPFFLSQLCIPYLIQTKGVIINVSSVAGFRPYPSYIAYCMTKAALDHLTTTLAADLAAQNVRVNSINPGFTLTDFRTKNGFTLEEYNNLIEKQSKLQPLGGACDPSETAKAICFMASDDSACITGQLLCVDGGRHIVPPE